MEERLLKSPSRSTKATVGGSAPVSPSRGRPEGLRRFGEPDEADASSPYVPWEPEAAQEHVAEAEVAEVPARHAQLICGTIREGARRPCYLAT